MGIEQQIHSEVDEIIDIAPSYDVRPVSDAQILIYKIELVGTLADEIQDATTPPKGITDTAESESGQPSDTTITATEHANPILGFLQNIDNEKDALEFARIALDSLEAGAEHTGIKFDRGAILRELVTTDPRIINIKIRL